MEESYTHYIYILRSEQWPSKDWYKVGYTTNPYRRIRDSCYATTYVKPCKYNTLYQFETCELKSEDVEKRLHEFLREREGIAHLYKEKVNSCKEMYDASLVNLRKAIDKYFVAEALNPTCITDETRITEIANTMPLNELELILQELDSDCITAQPLMENEECVACKRKLTRRAFVFEYKEQTYYIGPGCYAKYNIGGFKNVFNKELKKQETSATNMPDAYKVGLTTRILIHLIDTYRDIGDKFLQEYADKLIEKSSNISLWENLRLFFNENAYIGLCHCNFLYGLHTFFNMYEDEYGEEVGGGLECIKISKYDALCRQIKPITYEDIEISFDTFVFGSGNYEKKEPNLIDLSLRKKKTYIQTYMTNVKEDDEFYNAIKKDYDEADNDDLTTTTRPDEVVRELEDYECMKHNRGILQGLAGTGKSRFVAECFSDFFIERREEIETSKYKCYIVSPTGKACAVLKDKFKEALVKKGIDEKDIKDKKLLDEVLNSIKTIDSIIVNPYPIKHHRYKRVDLIIDEMSMLNINHLCGILEMNIWTKVLIMGDWHQLPPVKKRSIEGILVHVMETNKKKGTNIFSELSRMIRCEGPDRIPFEELCRNILTDCKDPIKFMRHPSLQKLKVLTCDTLDDVCKILRTDAMIARWMQKEHKQKEEKYIIEEDTGCRIIVSNKEEKHTIYGMQGIYEGFDEQNYDKKPLLGFRIKHTIRKNYYLQDSKHSLLHYNGEDQYVGQLKQLIENKETRKLCPGIFQKIERSEVITVHASQGSTYANTVVVLRKSEKRYRQVYTAITRWKKGCIVILYGTEKDAIPVKVIIGDEKTYWDTEKTIRDAMDKLLVRGRQNGGIDHPPGPSLYQSLTCKWADFFRKRLKNVLTEPDIVDNFIALHKKLYKEIYICAKPT